MTKIQSLMPNEDGMEHYLDGQKVEFEQIVDVSDEFANLPTISTMVKHGMIKVIEEPKVVKSTKKVDKDTKVE